MRGFRKKTAVLEVTVLDIMIVKGDELSRNGPLLLLLLLSQGWRQNFSVAGVGLPEFGLWCGFKKLCVPFLFLVEALSYTVRTNSSTHGRKNSFL